MTLTALVIDDLATERIHHRKILEKLGFLVHECADATSGVKLAERLMPNVILMDVVMPGESGFAASRALKRQPATAAIPIIMVTSKNRAPDLLNAREIGCSGYVVKPASAEALDAALRAAGVRG